MKRVASRRQVSAADRVEILMKQRDELIAQGVSLDDPRIVAIEHQARAIEELDKLDKQRQELIEAGVPADDPRILALDT